MSDKAIIIKDLSKKYELGLINSGTLHGDLKKAWARFRGKDDPHLKIDEHSEGDKEFWALKNISFEVTKGEIIGIIGKNGAGKSTLLKILSRVTSPTTGSLRVNGRIASLLEVGTGFHPDLSGRENIYLNGAILGMSRSEITRNLDEIIDFSGVARHIDTPVKKYSSGMYVRLAFAVAAHLESEILIIDEVLAVGDAEFQKKCLGKMGQISANDGRTVLFVSHNMQAVTTLCTHGIVLKKGISLPKMTAREAVSLYSADNAFADESVFPIITDEVIIHNFQVLQNGLMLSEFESGQPVDVLIEFELLKDLTHFRIGFFLKNTTGDLLNRSLLADWNENLTSLNKGHYLLKGAIPENLLVAGNYILQVHTSRYGIRDYVTCEPSSKLLTIIPPKDYNRAYMGEKVYGNVLIKQNWELKNV